MKTTLENKLAVITGAGQGIGLGIAQCMARAGAEVVLADIAHERLESARPVVAAEGRDCSTFETDVRDDNSVRALVEHTLNRHGRLDILVNNAGIVIVKPIDEQTEADWDAVVDVNLKGAFLCVKHALPALESSGGGVIVNLCSIAAFGFTTPHVPYSASKSGVIAFTRDLAFELAPRGIRVNAIAPGPIETPMFDGLTPEQKRAHAEKVPLRRLGHVHDIGDAAVFLASDAASFITGAILPVSGGTDRNMVDGVHRTRRLRILGGVALGLFGITACLADDIGTRDAIDTVTGFQSPEDIDVLAHGRALVTSGFSLSGHDSDLRIFYPTSGRVEVIYVRSERDHATAAMAAWGAEDCPGAPPGFAAHGIHVSRNSTGTYTLLAVNHTGREAIEWFELREIDGRFSAAWRGCVLVDAPYWINDVAILPDGGFVASHMMPREAADTMLARPPNDGIESGYVVEWQAAGGWRKVAGTEGALPNGIQVSHDGSVIYNNHYLGNQVVAVARASGRRLWTAEVEGGPDNLSITQGGDLLAATHLASLTAIGDCLTRPEEVCPLGFTVHRIDASTGTTRRILSAGDATFGGATTAVEVNGTIYLGAFAGKRIGRFSIPSRSSPSPPAAGGAREAR